ncbi:MAG TPA: penicillin-binding protein activator LpoB [Opitutaceae bacterium]|nr:penicillin-binding protein activator LpoB [Opitutaceae bacterium]
MKSRPLLPASALALLAGCAGAPAPLPPPAAEAAPAPVLASPDTQPQEIVAVTDRMARGIISLREISAAGSPPRILVKPVSDNTTFPIDGRVFLVRVRTELNSKSDGKVRFVDDGMLRTLQRERQAQTGETGVPTADYVLTGRLEGGPTNSSTDVSDSVVYSFKLTNARTSAVVWEDSVEMKRQGLQDVAPVRP